MAKTKEARPFYVGVWQPMHNNIEGNIGSVRAMTVIAQKRKSAILKACRRQYWPDKLFIPPDSLVELDEEATHFFVAFFPSGAAVGKIVIVQAKKKKDVWDQLPDKFNRRPAWVEELKTHKSSNW